MCEEDNKTLVLGSDDGFTVHGQRFEESKAVRPTPHQKGSVPVVPHTLACECHECEYFPQRTSFHDKSWVLGVNKTHICALSFVTF